MRVVACWCVLQVPLLLWISSVIICYCVSFQMLQGLQGPLASLNAASHVRYRLARVRLLASNYCFAETFHETDVWRVRFLEEVELMRSEYNALLYGGPIPHVVSTRGGRCMWQLTQQLQATAIYALVAIMAVMAVAVAFLQGGRESSCNVTSARPG